MQKVGNYYRRWRATTAQRMCLARFAHIDYRRQLIKRAHLRMTPIPSQNAMRFASQVRQKLVDDLSRCDAIDEAQLNDALRLLCKWRCLDIEEQVVRRHGTKVFSGPFKGLDFLTRSIEGCYVPKILGSYEQPLQPHIAEAIRTPYQVVLNIGAAEGYYAVGMARLMPKTRFFAYDLNATAQAYCGELAAKNGVSERVSVAARFTHEDFASFAGRATLVICDIEGAEDELLNPSRSPALANMDLIVESHESLKSGVTHRLCNRFMKTHSIVAIEDNGHRQLHDAPVCFYDLPHLDQLIGMWEWRSGPTPWLVMKSTARAG